MLLVAVIILGPLYVKISSILLAHTDDMQRYASICDDLFIYIMPMHMKKVKFFLLYI
jgi:hypothetical protein